MRFTLLLLLLLLLPLAVVAEEVYPEVQVIDPYLDLYTGPGRGYPIDKIVNRREWIQIIKRKTDWFKIKTSWGKLGWVHRDQLALTLSPSGQKTEIREPDIGDFSRRRWEIGFTGGQFNSAAMMSLYSGYSFTENLSIEVALSQVLGNYSSSLLSSVSLLNQPFPDLRFSPFVSIATGTIETKPRATLVQTERRSDMFANVGIGFRTYLTRRFILRAEYREYVVFTNNETNEEIKEWKAGFAFFF